MLGKLSRKPAARYGLEFTMCIPCRHLTSSYFPWALMRKSQKGPETIFFCKWPTKVCRMATSLNAKASWPSGQNQGDNVGNLTNKGMYTHTQTYTYVYTHVCMHSHTHTHTHSPQVAGMVNGESKYKNGWSLQLLESWSRRRKNTGLQGSQHTGRGLSLSGVLGGSWQHGGWL